MSAAPQAPGVPGFDVERRLGAGASCEVWLAREREGLRRPVALKVFVGGPDAYRRELEVVRRVEELRRDARCGGLVQSLATGEAEGLGFIAFEWLEGGTLEARVTSGGPLPFAEAVEVVRQVATALALLHRGNLFHRDVKPSNLLLGRDGRVRVADFGLSRPLDGALSSAGSPAFAAPEAIAGRPQDGRKLDVYSLGATLAWLLTGETMLPGRPDVFLLERHGVPRPLQRVIVRAMACDPAERIATADELLAALDGIGAAPSPELATHASPLPDVGARHASPLPAAEARHASPEPGDAPEAPPADATARRRAWDIVERTGYAAAAATALPIPGSEWVVVLPLHVTMVVGISEVHDVRLDQSGATDLLRRLGATVGLSYVGSRAATSVAKLLLPGVGGVAGAVVVYASTVAIGGVVIAFFERGGALDEAEVRALFRERLASAPRSFDPSRAGREPAGVALARRRFVERMAQIDHMLEAGLITPEDHAQAVQRFLEEAPDLPA